VHRNNIARYMRPKFSCFTASRVQNTQDEKCHRLNDLAHGLEGDALVRAYLTSCGSERVFEKSQQPGRHHRAVAARLVFERVRRPEMASAGNDNPAHEKTGPRECRKEGTRLARRIDEIVAAAVNEQEAHLITIDSGIADRG